MQYVLLLNEGKVVGCVVVEAVESDGGCLKSRSESLLIYAFRLELSGPASLLMIPGTNTRHQRRSCISAIV